ARRDNVGTGTVFFYLSDNLGSSREIVASGASSACYDADFYPYGGERAYTNTCPAADRAGPADHLDGDRRRPGSGHRLQQVGPGG
ncbi:MAG: hypothetical protein ACLP5E_11950, partial [Streptosporangiaceae bacterium]